ncbi:MAG: acyl-CoA dehydrogenase family protein [Dehalococcoidia bacterium]
MHFDHVRVPRTMLVGELNAGWRVIMGAIDVERASFSSPGLPKRQLDLLLAYANEQQHGVRPVDDPLVQDRLVRLAIEVESAHLMSYWVASLYDQGRMPQHETSLNALVKRETARRLDIAGLEMLGPYGPLREGSAWTPVDGLVEHDYREHIYFQFAAGGFDITRNVIAGRGLGLPRG